MKRLPILLVCAFGFCWSAGLFGQQTAKASGITFIYEVQGNDLRCKLSAPTNGWIGVGFNTKSSIVGSDLILFNTINGKPSSTDLFVKGVGNPVRDEEHGGKNNITLLNNTESDSFTSITFSIPLDSGDPNDFLHQINHEAWLILAYSVDDDFGHHSRVRTHIPFVIRRD